MAPNPARVLLADDQDVVIAGIRALLSAHATLRRVEPTRLVGTRPGPVGRKLTPRRTCFGCQMPEFGLLPFVRATREKHTLIHPLHLRDR